jgi:hypothetical protein
MARVPMALHANPVSEEGTTRKLHGFRGFKGVLARSFRHI